MVTSHRWRPEEQTVTIKKGSNPEFTLSFREILKMAEKIQQYEKHGG